MFHMTDWVTKFEYAEVRMRYENHGSSELNCSVPHTKPSYGLKIGKSHGLHIFFYFVYIGAWQSLFTESFSCIEKSSLNIQSHFFLLLCFPEIRKWDWTNMMVNNSINSISYHLKRHQNHISWQSHPDSRVKSEWQRPPHLKGRTASWNQTTPGLPQGNSTTVWSVWVWQSPPRNVSKTANQWVWKP